MPQETRHVIEQWLEARAKYHTGCVGGAHAYFAADERLLATFAADWTPDDPTMFATAYQGFRQALIGSVQNSSDGIGSEGAA